TAQELETGLGSGDRLANRPQYIRLVSFDLSPHGGGVENEVAGIPEIAVEQVLCGTPGIGFLDEGSDAAGAVIEAVSGADIAVSGGRGCRRNADCDDAALRGEASRETAGFNEKIPILNDMV